MISFGSGEGKLRVQLLLLICFLRTSLPVEQIEPMDWFLKKVNHEFVYRLAGRYSDFSV